MRQYKKEAKKIYEKIKHDSKFVPKWLVVEYIMSYLEVAHARGGQEGARKATEVIRSSQRKND